MKTILVNKFFYRQNNIFIKIFENRNLKIHKTKNKNSKLNS